MARRAGSRPAEAQAASPPVSQTPSPAELQAEGNPAAELVFVGEGITAGAQTPAGGLLAKMIEAMGLARASVYLVELTPGLELSQLAHLPAKVIVALGEPATRALLGSEDSVAILRGHFREPVDGTPHRARIMPTFHPSHLLEHPQTKRQAWSDLQIVARELGLAIPGRKG